MSQNIEIEFKNILDVEDFNRILSHFQIKERDFIKQINHYFDTSDFSLKKLGCALRIREKNGGYEMTLKQPHPDGLLETNEELTFEQTQQLLQGEKLKKGIIFTQLVSLGIDSDLLTYFGTLSTNRAELNFKEGLLVLDCSSYLNKIDYEVEYEVKNRNKGKEIFLNLLSELNIPVRNTKNKIQRFYERKKELTF